MSDEQDDIGHSILINQHRLDEEWLQQPTMMRKAARRLAELKQALAYAKSELEVIEADLSLKIRDNPSLYRLSADKKPTEDTVKSTVRIQPQTIAAHKKIADLTLLYDLAKADVDAIVHRKSALEDLVVLWCRDYFSTPYVDDPRAREKASEIESSKPRWRNTGTKSKKEGHDE